MQNSIIRYVIVFILTISLCPSIKGQVSEIQAEQKNENIINKLRESPITLSLELSNRYIWRGLEYGDAPVAFPMLSFNKSNFCAWAMGAYAINGSHQEVDLGVNYYINALNIGLSDYFYPSTVGDPDNYFETDNHKTGHWGELYAILTPNDIGLWFTLSCYVYGADKNPKGRQAYSSYAEIGYTYKFKDDNNLSLTLGANLNKGFYTDYESGFNIVNVALTYNTAFKFGNFKLPVSGSYIINPNKEKAYFKFSAYFSI